MRKNSFFVTREPSLAKFSYRNPTKRKMASLFRKAPKITEQVYFPEEDLVVSGNSHLRQYPILFFASSIHPRLLFLLLLHRCLPKLQQKLLQLLRRLQSQHQPKRKCTAESQICEQILLIFITLDLCFDGEIQHTFQIEMVNPNLLVLTLKVKESVLIRSSLISDQRRNSIGLRSWEYGCSHPFSLKLGAESWETIGIHLSRNISFVRKKNCWCMLSVALDLINPLQLMFGVLQLKMFGVCSFKCWQNFALLHLLEPNKLLPHQLLLLLQFQRPSWRRESLLKKSLHSELRPRLTSRRSVMWYGSAEFCPETQDQEKDNLQASWTIRQGIQSTGEIFDQIQEVFVADRSSWILQTSQGCRQLLCWARS